MPQLSSRPALSLVDRVRAAISAFQPRGAVRHELARLREEGYAAGEACEMELSVCIADPKAAGAAVHAMQGAGFVVDTLRAARGFLTARTTVVLAPFALAGAVTQLERAVAPYGGHVALVGATRPASLAHAQPRRDPSRVDSRPRGLGAVA